MLSANRPPIEVGTDIASILIAWDKSKPTPVQIASAFMHALEQYSMEVEGGSESILRGILYSLEHKAGERFRSI